jgi:hypothetical protein
VKPVGIRFPLSELAARFMRYAPEGDRACYAPCSTLEEAHGLWFLCPKCYHENKGAAGTHHVMCWFEDKVPPDLNPGPGRWTPAGSGLADLTFVPGERVKATSVQLTGGCRWHGHVIGGCATVLPG